MKYLPIITGYDNVESNVVVLNSNTVVNILIQWHCMCDFPVKHSPNFLNKDKNYLCLKPMVLVLRIITPSGIICGSGFNPQY